MLKLLFLLLAIVLAPLEGAQADAPPPTVSWKLVAPDLEVATVSEGMLSADLVLVRTSLTAFKIGVVRAADFGSPRASVRQLAAASGARAAINSNFFDHSGRALGLVVSRGSTYQRVQLGGHTLTGIFAIDSAGPRIFGRADYSPAYISEAVQAGPRLVTDGIPVATIKHSGAASRRAGICIDRAHRVIFYIIPSGILGATLEEVQRRLTLPGIDCVDALNFDGGGSAQMFVDMSAKGASTSDTELFFPGTDDIPVMLGLFPQK